MNFRPIADMVHDKNPVTLPETATVQLACKKMRDRRVGAVLVTDKRHHLVGIFTGRDAVTKMLAEGRNGATTQLLDVMTAKPSTLPPTMTSVDALRLMQDGGFRHVPVVEENGHIVSVISRGDFRGLEQARLDEETGLLERIR
jgi:CBS domain-containing protein